MYFLFESVKALRLSEKQRVSVWDLLEGHKNPAPLSWAWFGAVKMERKPMAYEEAHRLLKYHTHSMARPTCYFYEPIPLPAEELEPVPEKPVSFFLFNLIQPHNNNISCVVTVFRFAEGRVESRYAIIS